MTKYRATFKKLIPYLVTILCVFGTGYIKVLFNHLSQFDSPLLLFFTSIAFSAWYGGFYQGLIATILSLIFVINHFVPLETMVQSYLWHIRLLFYSVDCLVISAICAQLRRAKQQAILRERSKQNIDVRLKKVFESELIGLVFSNLNGDILEANQYFLNLIGADEKSLRAGKLNWKHFTPPEHMNQSLMAIERLKSKGFCPSFEKDYLRLDGKPVSVRAGATLVGDDYVVAYILDISDQKAAKKALEEARDRLEKGVALRTKQLTVANHELSKLLEEKQQVAERLSISESFLDSVVEHLPNMIFVKDAKDLRFVRFNKAGEELVGYKRETLIGKSDYDFFPKEQADHFVENDRTVLTDKVVVDIPEESISTTQGVRLLHTKKIPLFGKDGKPQYLLGISEDITEKKAAEKQKLDLMQSELARIEAEKLAERLTFLSEANTALSESLDIQYMLNAFANAITKNFSGWCFVDLCDENEMKVDRLMATSSDSVRHKMVLNQFFNYQVDYNSALGIGYTLKTGQARLYNNFDRSLLQHVVLGNQSDAIVDEILKQEVKSIMITPLRYHGKISGTLTFIAKDPLKPYTELDLSMAHDLSRRASLAIENARLYSKANEASRAKSAFLANISHEIRTPLGAMLGFAELTLDSNNLNSEQSEFITKIVSNGKQLLRLVNEVLDLSKVESDRIQIEKLEVSLPKLIEDVRSLLEVKAQEKDLRLTFQRSSNLPPKIYTDPLRLRQILINIIGNAIKFTNKGYVEVVSNFIPNTEKPETEGTLEFLVQDSGIGIAAEHAERLFAPFMQADESMTRKFGGTGLGLFLSRKLAKLLGGNVELEESHSGIGSRFKITISTEFSIEAFRPKEQSLDAPEVELHSTKKANVLVVEDSLDNQMLMKAFLSKLDLDVDFAGNGREGVEKSFESKYDLILMDIQMPEMDGFEAIQKLRQSGYAGPVIALTAHGMKGDRERCLNSGFDDYLCKPFTKQSLSLCVAQNLNR